MLVLSTLSISTAILAEATLSFLGLGPRPPTATWGSMISDGTSVLETAPWVVLFPGLAITLTVLGFSLFGDGLRDALDVRLATGDPAIQGEGSTTKEQHGHRQSTG